MSQNEKAYLIGNQCFRMCSAEGVDCLCRQEQEARKPLPPEILINAKQDRVHEEKTSRNKPKVRRIPK